MKHVLLQKTFTFAASMVLTVLTAGSAYGQVAPGGKVLFDKPTFEDIQSPDFMIAGGKQKRFKGKDWLEIEIKLNLPSAIAKTKSKVVENLTVKWYVAVKNPDKAGTTLLLTKEVEHINIATEEDVYCSVYLSPVSVKRLTGFDRAGKNAVEAVGYEVLVDGEKIGGGTSKFQVGWWDKLSDKIARSETVPLLTKNETPFQAMWWDRYAEVKSVQAAK